MIATIEHFALALEEPVGELADSSANTLHPTGNRVIGVCFDQEMHVIALNRVVHHPEAVADAGFTSEERNRRTDPGLA